MMTAKVIIILMAANVLCLSGHDDLFFTIYEKIPVQSGNLHPAMWRYRARITLEHLTHALQERTAGRGIVILREFLRLVGF